VADTRTCEQCGASFAPRREHARFCRPRCRVAWNREHTGDPQAEASALEWSITAMREAIERLARDQVPDHEPPGFNSRPVIGGFSCVQRAELPVFARGGSAGLHPLGAASSKVAGMTQAAPVDRAGATQCR